ncbi:MAG: hypothetical protein IPK15_13180 [Verrucomicrobia bacterium]|nr:hypothetical protein [Verrucomicrobiota bacterium]
MLFQAKEVFEEVCIQVDLECDDRQNASEKTVIDRIGAPESSSIAINSVAPQSQSVAQEITRIRKENAFKKAEQLTPVGSKWPTSTTDLPIVERRGGGWSSFYTFCRIIIYGAICPIVAYLMSIYTLPLVSAVLVAVMGKRLGGVSAIMYLCLSPIVYYIIFWKFIPKIFPSMK